MLRVEPIIMVHMAKIQPTILALLALSRRVCRKTARPIWARIHPSATRASRSGEVLVKKLVESTKLPSRKKMTLVSSARRKLKSPQTSQQLLIFMPFIFIICTNFSSFSNTSPQSITGNSRLSASGKISAETVFMIESTKDEAESPSRITIQPLCTLFPVLRLVKAEQMQCCSAKKPQADRMSLVPFAYPSPSNSFLVSTSKLAPLLRCSSRSLTSLMEIVALSWLCDKVWKSTAPSGIPSSPNRLLLMSRKDDFSTTVILRQRSKLIPDLVAGRKKGRFLDQGWVLLQQSKVKSFMRMLGGALATEPKRVKLSGWVTGTEPSLLPSS